MGGGVELGLESVWITVAEVNTFNMVCEFTAV